MAAAEVGKVAYVRLSPDEWSDTFKVCSGPAARPNDWCTTVHGFGPSASPAGHVHRIHAAEVGDWSISVQAPEGPVRYLLAVSVEGIPPHDDCGTGADAPADPASAPTLALPAVCAGALHVNAGDSSDLYAVAVPAGHRLSVDFTGHGEFAQACLFAPDAPGAVCSGYARAGESAPVAAYATAAGTWILRVASGFGGGAYSLAVATAPAADPGPHDDCASGGDASDSAATPTLLTPAVACSGSIRPLVEDAGDWYGIPVEAGQRIRIDLEADATLLLTVAVFRPDGEWYDHRPGGKPLLVRADEPGVWKLALDGAHRTGGAYGMRVEVFDAALPLPDEADAAAFEAKDRGADLTCRAEGLAAWGTRQPAACPDLARLDDSTFLRDSLP